MKIRNRIGTIPVRRAEPTAKRIHVLSNGASIADTTRALRVLETSHPRVYYIPAQDVRLEYLTVATRRTFSEFKGSASYWTLKVGNRRVENAAWSYQTPSAGYEALKG
jgi:uncharacterized protein (DUF427 family)